MMSSLQERVRTNPRWALARALSRYIGMSRHSAMPTLRRVAASTPLSLAPRLLTLAVANLSIGVGVVLFVASDLGLAPYDLLASGLGTRLHVTLGQAAWLMAAGFFTAAALLGRRPTLWAVAFTFGNGLAIDLAGGIANQPGSFVGQVMFVVAGVFSMAIGVNVALHSGLTGGPFELLMSAADDRGRSPVKTRYGLDLGVFAAGSAVGGPLGIGTVIHAATFGIVLHLVGQAFRDHRSGRQQRKTPAEPAPTNERRPQVDTQLVGSGSHSH